MSARTNASIYLQILDQVVNDIQGLSLTDLPDANVKRVKADKECERVEIGLPGIAILPFGQEAIPLNGGTNARDDIGYRVAVIMLDCHQQDNATGTPAAAGTGEPDQAYEFDDRLEWREKIRKRFIRQRLPPVDCVYTCEVEPLQVIDQNFLERSLWKSTLVLRFVSRETRGC